MTKPTPQVSTARLTVGPTVLCAAILVVVMVVAAGVGSVALPPQQIVLTLLDRLPWVHFAGILDETGQAIFWSIRLPRVVLGALVGALLAGCGATYQGIFRNPLADPYLLGAAAGAGLGAVIAIVAGVATAGPLAVPIFAFAGSVCAVALTYGLGVSGRAGGTVSLILAGVAVSAFLSAIQTFIMQRNTDQLQQIYSWLLGRLVVAGWSEVVVVLPYAVISLGIIVASRRVLDVLSVGDDEARTLGLNPQVVRVVLVLAASLGTAAAVSVAGLIGFIGLVVPHLVRMIWGSSFRVIVPLSIVLGAAVLVAADTVARTALAPAEIPIGVVTAFIGAPFFALILRRGGS